MATVRTLLLVVVLPPLAALLAAILAVVIGRAAARSASALARAHFAWPAGSSFTMHVPARRKHASWKVALEQRDHELRVSLYRKGAEAVECAFCLSGVEEGDEVRELRCRHLFHRACLDRWLARPPATCPLCRSRLLTTVTSSSPPPLAAAPWDWDSDGEEEDSDMVLLMAYMRSSGSWLWSP